MKMLKTKFVFLGSLLLLCSNSAFAQLVYPDIVLEHRIVNLCFNPEAGDNGSIIFELQLRAGNNYQTAGYRMTNTQIFFDLDLESGVVVDKGAMSAILPSPNLYGITPLYVLNNTFPFPPGANAFYVYMGRGLSGPDFTDTWGTVGTIILPLAAGSDPPTDLSFLTMREYEFAIGSGWASAFYAGAEFQYGPSCPVESHICIDPYPIFDFETRYCVGDEVIVFPLESKNGVQGTWSPASVSTSAIGTIACIFTPDTPDWYCGVTVNFAVLQDDIIIEVEDIDACIDAPFDLSSAVVLNGTDIIDYTFYTYNGSDYDLIIDPTQEIQSASGNYTYYAKYYCSSVYESFTVIVHELPAVPEIILECNVLDAITSIDIIAPLGPEYTYSIDGIDYFTSPNFSPIGLPNITVYVQDGHGCISTLEVDCFTCLKTPELTLTPGSGKICIGTGDYSIEGTFNTDSVVVSISKGSGSLDAELFKISPFTVEYTPDNTDAGDTVVLVFTIPGTASCSEVIDSVKFAVDQLPTAVLTRDFARFDCNNQHLNLVLRTNNGCSTCSGYDYLWNAGDSPLDCDSVIVFSSSVAPSGTTYTVSVTNLAGCVATANTMITKDITPPPPPVIDSTHQKFCDEATVANLNAYGNDVKWYATPTGGTPLLESTSLKNDSIYYAAQVSSDNGCESDIRSGVKVTIVPSNELLLPNVENQTLCDDALVSDILTDGSSGIIFFAPDGTELDPSDQLTVSGTYKAIYRYGTPPNICESEDSTKFYITLNDFPADPPVIDDQTFCAGAMIANIVVPNNGIVWYLESTTTEQLAPGTPLEDRTYWAAQSKGGTCDESTRIPVIIIIDNPEPPITYPPYEFCYGANLGSINVSGFGITWYDDHTLSTELPLSTVIPLGTNNYFVTQRGSGTCESAATPVTVEITTDCCPYVEIPSPDPSICMGSGDYTVSGTFINADSLVVTHDGLGTLADSIFKTSPFNIAYTPAAGDAGHIVTLTFTVEDDLCGVITETVSFDVLPLALSADINTRDTTTCVSEDVELTTLVSSTFAAPTYHWYATLTGTTEMISTLVNPGTTTTYYVAVSDATHCEGAANATGRDSIVVTVIVPSLASYITTRDTALCDAESVNLNNQVTSTGVTNPVYRWYTTLTGNTLVSPITVSPAITTTYYVSVSGDNYCEGEASAIGRDSIIVTVTVPSLASYITTRDTILCDGESVNLNNQVTSTGVTNPVYRWYTTLTGNTPVSPVTVSPAITTTYYVSVSGDNYCEGEASDIGRDSVVVTVTPQTTVANIVAKDSSMCAGEDVYLPDLVTSVGVTTPVFKWYTTLTGNVEVTPLTVSPSATTTYYVSVQGDNFCEGAPNATGRAAVKITISNCNELLDCESMVDRVVEEKVFGDCKYVHDNATWDIAPDIMSTLDSACYFINGILVSHYPLETLENAEFDIGVSEVMVIGFSGIFSDTCEFTVTVERLCPSTVADTDPVPHTYNVTKAASLCWTSNLRATEYAGGGDIAFAQPYYCEDYSDVAAHDSIFGLLYTWYSAVGVPEGSSTLPTPDPMTGFVQGICPDGWHIPSQAELDALNMYDAKDLMSTNYWLVPGTNATSFDARPAGRYDSSIDRFVDLYGFTGFWAADANTGNSAPYFSLTYYCSLIEKMETLKSDGLSVRCVWDGETCP